MTWFYLALLAPLLYAIVNLIDDNLLRSMYKGPYVAAMLSGLLGALPIVLMPFVDLSNLSLKLSLMMVAAGFLTILYYFFYFKALAIEAPSVVIGVLALVPATLPLLSAMFLGEYLSRGQLLGLTLVLIGSFGLSISLDEFKKPKFSKAAPYLFLIVIILNVISLLLKHVYNNSDFLPAYLMFTLGVGLGGLYFLIIIMLTRNMHDLSVFERKLRRIIPIFITVEIINILAEYTSNLAISKGPVSLVRAIESIQPIYVLLLAIILYPVAPKLFREAEEDGKNKKLILISIAVGGLVIINLLG